MSEFNKEAKEFVPTKLNLVSSPPAKTESSAKESTVDDVSKSKCFCYCSCFVYCIVLCVCVCVERERDSV